MPGAKVPAPPLQVPDDAEPATAPFRFTVPLAHITWSAPALTVAKELIVMVILSEAGTQGPAPSGSFVVSVKVTVPAVISPALGVYTGFKVVLPGAKIPVPPLQVTDVAEPPIVPFKDTVLFAQIV